VAYRDVVEELSALGDGGFRPLTFTKAVTHVQNTTYFGVFMH
jgi:hypothetical protein